MRALERAVSSPVRVGGLPAVSPVAGLARRSIGFADVLGQSVSAVAPAAAATTTTVIVAAVAGSASFWSMGTALVVALLVASTVNQFTRRIAATGSLYTFVARGLGAGSAVVAGIALLIGYGFIAMFTLTGAGFYVSILLARLWPGMPSAVIVAAIVIAVMGAVGFLVVARGVRLTTRLTLVIELVSVAIILVLVVALFVSTGAGLDWGVLGFTDASPSSIVVGTAIAMTAYVGFESSATLGVEAKRPFAVIPRAITWTVIASGGLYLVTTFAQLSAFDGLGVDLASSIPANDLTAAFGVPAAGILLDVSIVASFFACALASITALSRVLFAMGREGGLPYAVGRTHPRFRTPIVAIAIAVPVVTVVPIVAVLLTGAIWPVMEVLILCSAAGYITAYVFVCVAAPVFLHRIGELTAWPVVRAAVAAIALTGILAVYMIEESSTSRVVGVWVFWSVLAVGVASYAIRVARRPWLRTAIGVYDSPVAADVLGGSTGP